VSDPSRVFLSCVSGEFNTVDHPYRNEMYRVLRRGHRREVRVQEDFSEHHDTLLNQLDQYIKSCTSVIHLIGDVNGSIPSKAQVTQLLKDPQFLADYPDLRGALLKKPVASFTQWEAYLALHHKRALYVYVPADKEGDPIRTPRGIVKQSKAAALRQQRHLARIKKLGLKRGTFKSKKKFCRWIWNQSQVTSSRPGSIFVRLIFAL
jgi:hypothetical protein